MNQVLVRSKICPGCACLCDDIDLLMEAGKVASVNNVCQWGVARFTGSKKFSEHLRRRLARHRLSSDDGNREVERDEAVEAARKLTDQAQRIVVYGLCQMSEEAFPWLFRLLHDRRALFVPSEGPLWTAYLRQTEQNPAPATTLETVRNQADLVLYWGANPIHSCPRLLSRYTFFARGRFTERGFEDRRSFAVDIQETEMARVMDMIAVAPGQETALLASLLDVAEGKPVRPVEGVRSKSIKELVRAVEEGQYRVIFIGRGPFYGPDGPLIVRDLLRLSRALNRSAPTFLMPLATDFNTAGFYRAFWPQLAAHRDRWELLDDLSAWRPQAGDLLLAVSGDPLWFLDDARKEGLKSVPVPIVSLAAYETMTTAAARVNLAVGLLGIETAGHATRLDGVTLPLSPVVASNRPSDTEILEKLAS